MLQAQASQKPDKPGPCGFNLNHDCKQNSSWHRLCPVLITSVTATLRGKSDVQINPCVKEKQHCGGANYKPFECSLSGSHQKRKPERLRQCKYSSAGVRMGEALCWEMWYPPVEWYHMASKYTGTLLLQFICLNSAPKRNKFRSSVPWGLRQKPGSF